MTHTRIGRLANRDAAYFDGKFSVEKDHKYLVEPTDDELAEIYRLVTPDPLAPARGIMFALAIMVITAAMLAIGIIVYFTCF